MDYVFKVTVKTSEPEYVDDTYNQVYESLDEAIGTEWFDSDDNPINVTDTEIVSQG